ncbi:hypothetical protein RRG08_049317, partial [Elysia crispata]
ESARRIVLSLLEETRLRTQQHMTSRVLAPFVDLAPWLVVHVETSDRPVPVRI